MEKSTVRSLKSIVLSQESILPGTLNFLTANFKLRTKFPLKIKTTKPFSGASK